MSREGVGLVRYWRTLEELDGEADQISGGDVRFQWFERKQFARYVRVTPEYNMMIL
jgi:hypothetical protein